MSSAAVVKIGACAHAVGVRVKGHMESTYAGSPGQPVSRSWAGAGHGQEMVKPAKSFSFDSANFCRYCGRPPG